MEWNAELLRKVMHINTNNNKVIYIFKENTQKYVIINNEGIWREWKVLNIC